METIEGKTAFITGGARGIGLGMARAFAGAKAKLAIVDLDAASLDTAKSELGKRTQVEAFVLDVRDREAYARIADDAERRLGPVSILCNNAGVAGGAPVDRLTYAYWDWVMGINVNGVINGVQTFLPRLLAHGGEAHIVNTASGAGLAATSSGVLYTTSKFAVVGLSEALRLELEPHGIGVSVLCPGPVRTQILQHVRETEPPRQRTAAEAQFESQRLEQASAFLAQGVPPDEVGQMVLAAVRANRLYVHTDRIMEELIKTRARDLLDALPGL